MNTRRTRFTNHVRAGTSNLLKDDNMGEWLGLQEWSNFAQDLHRYYQKTGGFTEKQLASAVKMRAKVDEHYDPYGNDVEIGVYIDDEEKNIFKISIIKNNTGQQIRSVRKRLMSMPGWIEIKMASKKALLFESIKTGVFRMLEDEELIRIGKQTGICCDCGRILDNPQSVAAGIGPHCAKMRKKNKKEDEIDE